MYVATIQRMAINVLGRQAIFGLGDEEIDEDAGKLDIPIHAFDLIVADECHRGYTSQEVSVCRLVESSAPVHPDRPTLLSSLSSTR